MRFDLTTVIVAHFAYNAGLGALPLLRSEEPYFVVSGLVVVTMMLAPVIPGVVGAVWRRLRGEARGILHPQIRPGTVSDLGVLAALPIEDLDWGALVLLCYFYGQHMVVPDRACSVVGGSLRSDLSRPARR